MTDNDYKSILTQGKLKITNTRVAILTILSDNSLPLDVSQIEEALNQKKIHANQVTVYRILEALVNKKIIKRIDFQEGKFRYEMARDGHHHLICQQCGTVQDVAECPVDEIEKNIGMRQHFIIKQHSLEFFGVCANCQ